MPVKATVSKRTARAARREVKRVREKINPQLRGMVIALDQLTLDPVNARLHPDRSIEALKFALSRFGQQKPVVITRDRVVVAGNGLVTAARALGWRSVAAVVIDTANPEEVRAFAVADNRTAELSVWDLDQLGDALEELQRAAFPVEGLGWLHDELEQWASEGARKAGGGQGVPGPGGPGGEDEDEDDAPGGRGQGPPMAQGGRPIQLTPEQREVFDRACEKLRAMLRTGDEDILNDGRCVELICADFLS